MLSWILEEANFVESSLVLIGIERGKGINRVVICLVVWFKIFGIRRILIESCVYSIFLS